MTDVTILVPEISCDTCRNAIEGALRPMAGVLAADVDIDARQVRVEFDESAVTREMLAAVIEEHGYTVPADG